MQFNLISAKGTRKFSGTTMQAIEAAIAMEEELQPALGVTVELDGETIAEITDGAVDGRKPSEWWAWHDEDQARWSATEEEAEDRCAAWTRGESGDGPDY